MRIAILGATKGMGREVARRLALRGDSLVLLGRSPDALEATAEDLRIRGARVVHVVPCDLADETSFAPALESARDQLTELDSVIVTAGGFGTQDQLEADLELAHTVLDLNLTKTILFCEHARRLLLEGGGGTLVVFSSVAGDRGRRSNGIYSASKAGLSHYLEALDHRFHDKGLVTVCVKPGFVRTGMTAGLDEPPFAANPEDVATAVVAGMDRGKPVVYATSIWGWIMLVIKFLPRFVMRRLNF